MDIEYKGGNCVVISTKKNALVVDPMLSKIGLKDVIPKEAVVAVTQNDFLPRLPEGSVAVDQPGEYEVGDFSINGVAAQRMIDHDGSKAATMYRIKAGDVSIAVVGHVLSPLSDEQLESLGVIDIAIVPVGGGGYTSDAHQAVSIVRQLDPKVVIPVHYADGAIKYEVAQNELEPFVKELSASAQETVAKYKIKNGILPDTLTLIELTRTS